jgi:TatD DNase family protein
VAGSLIDSHCHLADDAFVDDRAAVLERARAAGLTHALCILAADNETEVARAKELVASWPLLRFGVGLHPHQAGVFAGREQEVADFVRGAISRIPETRAVGEIGLDYHYDFAPKATQHAVFRAQVRLARELDLPIVIHTREAEDDTLAILQEEGAGTIRGVLHCFTGSQRLADEALRLGLHISFAGIVTFPKAASLRKIAEHVPANRLLCETDSPYLAPTPHRGKRNEPAWVARVVEDLAAARGVTAEQLRDQIAANFQALFRP